MAQNPKDPFQLDLFEHARNEHASRLRETGGDALAGTLPADGARVGGGGPPGGGALGSAGTDAGRNGIVDAGLSATGTDAAAGPRSRVGAGAGEVSSSAPGGRVAPL